MVPSTVYVHLGTYMYVGQLPFFNNVFKNFTFIFLKDGLSLHKTLKLPRGLMRSRYCYLTFWIRGYTSQSPYKRPINFMHFYFLHILVM